MSARMIVVPSDSQLAEGETSTFWRRGPGSPPSARLSANPALHTPSSLEDSDSEKLRDHLRRRFETVDPLPWWHGGLNE